MEKLKIFVACHKPCDVKRDEVYVPIHVGRAISKCSQEMSDMIGDDTGDSISERNPFYSEMTAQYWAWKNYHDSEYVGFCHYRRYFIGEYTSERVEEIFDKEGYDVIMNEPLYRPYTRYMFLENYVSAEDRYIMQKVIKDLYPEYYQSFLAYSNGYVDYTCNMLICKKDLFDAYAQWIFTILFECEKYIKLAPYTRGRRVYGYIAEFLMPVYFLHHNKKIKVLPYQNKYGEVTCVPQKQKIRIWLKSLFNRKHKYKDIKLNSSIEAGLKQDGII